MDDARSCRYFHGTKADLTPNEQVEPGHRSNFGSGQIAKHVYLTATLDAAIWGAELANGSGPGCIYVVEPTGPIEDDPNPTDKKFPGNPTKSYRSRHPLVVVDEVTGWEGHDPEALASMRAMVAQAREAGIEAIDD